MRAWLPKYKSWYGQPYALSDYADVKFYGPGFPGCVTSKELRAGRKINVPEVIKKLYPGDYPDIIIQGDPQIGGLFYSLKDFHRARCLRAMRIIDLHNVVGRPKVYHYLQEGNIDLALRTGSVETNTEWGKKLKATGVKVLFYPFSVDDSIFYDRGLPRKYDVTNIGVLAHSPYPLRRRIHNYFTDKTPYDEKRDQGYAKRGFKQRTIIKKGIKYHYSNARSIKYSKEINRSKIFATGIGSIGSGGVLQKFFEVLACNTLLLSNVPRDAKLLGFKPGINFAEIDCYPKAMSSVRDEVFLKPIRYFLSHPGKAQAIAKRGHDLVHSRHTHEIRAKEIINKISRILR